MFSSYVLNGALVLKKQETLGDSYLADSETGEDTDAFFSFFPEPSPLFPPLCFGDRLDFLDEGESLLLNCSGDACWRETTDQAEIQCKGHLKMATL